MSEGDVQPSTMVVAEAHNIGTVRRYRSEILQLIILPRDLPCSPEDVRVSVNCGPKL